MADVSTVPRLESAYEYEQRGSIILEILKAQLSSHVWDGATVLLI